METKALDQVLAQLRGAAARAGLNGDTASTAVVGGKPTLSAAIKLVQQNGDTPGALLFIPMYRRGTDPTSVSQRRAALIGVVYAPLVYEELLKHLAEVELE